MSKQDDTTPDSVGGVVHGAAVPTRLELGEHVYWPDGSVSVMGEEGLRRVEWTWRRQQ